MALELLVAGAVGAGVAAHIQPPLPLGTAPSPNVAKSDREEDVAANSDVDDSVSNITSEDVASSEEPTLLESGDVCSDADSSDASSEDRSSDEDADELAQPDPDVVDCAAYGAMLEPDVDPGDMLEMMENMRPPPDTRGVPVPGDASGHAEGIVARPHHVCAVDTDRGRLT